jgi:hypothetical protein
MAMRRLLKGVLILYGCLVVLYVFLPNPATVSYHMTVRMRCQFAIEEALGIGHDAGSLVKFTWAEVINSPGFRGYAPVVVDSETLGRTEWKCRVDGANVRIQKIETGDDSTRGVIAPTATPSA